MALTRNTYQRNTSWSAPYTFSGKEKDAETGHGYFGERYYDSGLSIWLSVDPMSDKYPSMSPYNYCANNPVMLVDPDGRRIYLTGVLAQFFVSQIKKQTNLTVSYDKNSEILSFSGTSQNRFDDLLLEASTNDNIIINIHASFLDDADDLYDGAGQFWGAYKDLDGKVYATQKVDCLKALLFSNFFGSGDGAFEMHELTESIISAKAVETFGDIPPAYEGKRNPGYSFAHEDAFPGDFDYSNKVGFASTLSLIQQQYNVLKKAIELKNNNFRIF